MNELKILQDLDVNKKTVIVRVDLNVPIIYGKVEDATRIIRLVPTLEYLLSNNAKIVVISHFGRPGGKVNRDMSLAALADELSKALGGKEVKFGVDCIGTSAIEAVSSMQYGEIILMENLRFHPGEEENDTQFAAELAKLGEIYINDTFSCSHRNHASITGLAKLLTSAAGFLLQDEINNLEKIFKDPKLPIAAIVGGSKVSTKLGLLQALIDKVSMLAIGGAMANTFLKALGYNIGASLFEEKLLPDAQKIVEWAKEKGCDLILPIDIVTSLTLQPPSEFRIVDINNVDNDSMILDIGPKTVNLIVQKLANIKTLVWNGPLGAFEYKPFDISTVSLAREISALSNEGRLISVAGGGDIVSALTNAGLDNNFSYISTAGGAFLEWLEGKELPGIEVLKNSVMMKSIYMV
jgi:phosphoglycerate kinase